MAKSREKTIFMSPFLYLARSKKYRDTKAYFRTIFKDPTNKVKQWIDYFLIVLILSSVAIFIYEVKNPIPVWLEYYAVYFASAIFLIEYMVNFWLYNDIHKDILTEYNKAKIIGIKPNYYRIFFKSLLKKLSYIITPVAIIDLLAILPAYRPLRILRIFVLFRFLKLLKHSKSLYQFVEVLSDRKFELLTLLVLFVFVVVVGGLAIYTLEDMENENIKSLIDALYWSFITITTVGYGDISPVTIPGKVVSLVIIILGITMISFATSVIVSAFSEKLHELKEDRITEHLQSKSEFLVICGYGQLTKVFLQKNRELIDSNEYIILDNDASRVQEANLSGYRAINDDASRYEVLKRFYNNSSKITLLALTGDDVENIYITLNAKSLSRKIRVIAAARDIKLYNKYVRAGVDRVVLPNELASSVLTSSIAYPTIFKAVNAILSSKNVATLDEYYIDNYSKIKDKSVQELDLNRYNIVLFAIKKGFKGVLIFNPKSDYIVKDGDILIVLGNKIAIEYFRELHNLGSYS